MKDRCARCGSEKTDKVFLGKFVAIMCTEKGCMWTHTRENFRVAETKSKQGE